MSDAPQADRQVGDLGEPADPVGEVDRGRTVPPIPNDQVFEAVAGQPGRDDLRGERSGREPPDLDEAPVAERIEDHHVIDGVDAGDQVPAAGGTEAGTGRRGS
jgi:hypothetical protein